MGGEGIQIHRAKEMKAHESVISKMRPKEFIETLNKCVNYLVERIYNSSKI